MAYWTAYSLQWYWSDSYVIALEFKEMKISEYLILVKSFELLWGNFHLKPSWRACSVRTMFLKSIVAIFKENGDFPSKQRKQSRRDWTLYPISTSIRKSTIASPFWIAFEAIQRTYWLVNNRKSDIFVRKNVKYAIFKNKPISVLYYPCKALQANPKSQNWFIDENSDSICLILSIL